MSTARAGWCCSDNSPHRPTVAPLPSSPSLWPQHRCRPLPQHLRRPIFFSSTDVAKAVSSPFLFFFFLVVTTAGHPSLRPPRCLSSLYAHPSDAKAAPQCRLDAYRPLSCARLAASCAARPAVAMCARHPNFCSPCLRFNLRANVSCAPPQTGSLLLNGQPESTPMAD